MRSGQNLGWYHSGFCGFYVCCHGDGVKLAYKIGVRAQNSLFCFYIAFLLYVGHYNLLILILVILLGYFSCDILPWFTCQLFYLLFWNPVIFSFNNLQIRPCHSLLNIPNMLNLLISLILHLLLHLLCLPPCLLPV